MPSFKVAAGTIPLFSISIASAEHWTVRGQGGWGPSGWRDAAHRLYAANNARIEVLHATTGQFPRCHTMKPSRSKRPPLRGPLAI